MTPPGFGAALCDIVGIGGDEVIARAAANAVEVAMSS